MRYKTIQLVMPLVLLILVGFAYGAFYLGTKAEIDIHVKDKERVVQTSGELITSRYLVYTDSEVFQNTDSWVFLKWNSSDVYNQLEEGGNYRVVVAGWRIPFFSWYRNIIKVQ